MTENLTQTTNNRGTSPAAIENSRSDKLTSEVSHKQNSDRTKLSFDLHTSPKFNSLYKEASQVNNTGAEKNVQLGLARMELVDRKAPMARFSAVETTTSSTAHPADHPTPAPVSASTESSKENHSFLHWISNKAHDTALVGEALFMGAKDSLSDTYKGAKAGLEHAKEFVSESPSEMLKHTEEKIGNAAHWAAEHKLEAAGIAVLAVGAGIATVVTGGSAVLPMLEIAGELGAAYSIARAGQDLVNHGEIGTLMHAENHTAAEVAAAQSQMAKDTGDATVSLALVFTGDLMAKGAKSLKSFELPARFAGEARATTSDLEALAVANKGRAAATAYLSTIESGKDVSQAAIAAGNIARAAHHIVDKFKEYGDYVKGADESLHSQK